MQIDISPVAPAKQECEGTILPDKAACDNLHACFEKLIDVLPDHHPKGLLSADFPARGIRGFLFFQGRGSEEITCYFGYRAYAAAREYHIARDEEGARHIIELAMKKGLPACDDPVRLQCGWMDVAARIVYRVRLDDAKRVCAADPELGAFVRNPRRIPEMGVGITEEDIPREADS